MKQLTTRLKSVLNWPLDSLDTQIQLKSDCHIHTKYPIRFLRYWFMFNLIRNHQININRPLRICEIGVDSGQMRCYMENTKPIDIECWDAVDKKIKPILMQFGYNQKIEANVDKNDFELNDQYDVIIVLHLLEHLFEPESLISKLSTALKPDGIIIGGFPAVPDFLRSHQQQKNRMTAKEFGHVSTFSPKRVINMAKSCGLNLNFLSGTFFLRKRNFPLENHAAWIRLNLLWGALLPSLSGEIYWQMNRPGNSGNSVV